MNNIFVVSLEYKVDLIEVDKYLADHRLFLKKYYSEKVFIASGPKQPRTGGVIIAIADDLITIKQILSQDPFSIHNIANYVIVEFSPTMWSQELAEAIK